MIETVVTVMGLDGAWALVEAEQKGCGRCHEPGGCGGNSASQLFCQGPRRFRVLNPVGARVGERVYVGVPEGAVYRSALMLYVLPLLSMVLAAALSGWLGGERLAILGALVGGVGAWGWVRRWQRQNADLSRLQPVILNRLSEKG